MCCCCVPPPQKKVQRILSLLSSQSGWEQHNRTHIIPFWTPLLFGSFTVTVIRILSIATTNKQTKAFLLSIEDNATSHFPFRFIAFAFVVVVVLRQRHVLFDKEHDDKVQWQTNNNNNIINNNNKTTTTTTLVIDKALHDESTWTWGRVIIEY